MGDETKRNSHWILFLPGLGGWFFLLLMALFLLVDPDKLLWDGDVCRHFLNGIRFLSDFRIPTSNYMSAFFSTHPAPSYSFVADLILGTLYSWWGLNGLELICALALALGLMWSYQFARARGLGSLSGPFLLVLTTLACSIEWSANSKVFGYLAFLILYHLSFLSSLPERQKMLYSAAVMFLWVNIDGSFLIGFVLLIAKVLGQIFETAWGRSWGETETLPLLAVTPPSPDSLRSAMLTLLLCAAAVCLNLGGIQFLFFTMEQALSNMRVLQASLFEPVDIRRGAQSLAYMLVYAITVSFWIWSARMPRAWEFLLVNVLFFLPLFGLAFIPYFALAALPAMGPAWSLWRANMLKPLPRTVKPPGPKAWLRNGTLKIFHLERGIENHETSRLSEALVRLGLGVAMCVLYLILPAVHVHDFSPDQVPVSASDYIKANLKEANGFVYANWGSYIYWRLHRPIFIDERMYAYPESFVKEYQRTLEARAGWQHVLDKYKIGYALIPHSALLGAALTESPQWQRVFDDQASEVYVRKQ